MTARVGWRGCWWLGVLPLVALFVPSRLRTLTASTGVPPRRHVVEIRGMAFHPAVLELVRGDTVVWVNHDIVPHSATATESPRWNTGILTQGEDGRYAPPRSGEAPYICTLHPTMRGKLIIR